MAGKAHGGWGSVFLGLGLVWAGAIRGRTQRAQRLRRSRRRNTKTAWKRLEPVFMRVAWHKWLGGRMGAGCARRAWFGRLDGFSFCCNCTQQPWRQLSCAAAWLLDFCIAQRQGGRGVCPPCAALAHHKAQRSLVIENLAIFITAIGINGCFQIPQPLFERLKLKFAFQVGSGIKRDAGFVVA